MNMSNTTEGKTQANEITKWASDDGHFRRQASTFRDYVTKDGPFTPETNRYHLFVSIIHFQPGASIS
jgi:putative glutathione S-transferase